MGLHQFYYDFLTDFSGKTSEMDDQPRLNEIISQISNYRRSDLYELGQRQRIYKSGLRNKLHASVWVNKDTGEETNIVIKSMPRNDGLNGPQHIFRNEIYFYCAIFPALDQFQKQKKLKKPFLEVARYLGGSISSEKEYLFLENLNAAGYCLSDDRSTFNDIKKVFKMFGKFHALSSVYRYEKPENFENMCSELVDLNKVPSRMIPNMKRNFGEAMDALKDSNELSAEIWEKLKVLDDVRGILIQSREYPGPYKCFTHGDSRAHNMMFKHTRSGELEDIKLTDFHKVYPSTPIYDLSYFFYSEASITNLEHLDHFLDIYYDSFSSFVKELGHEPQEIYPFHAIKEEWKKYCSFGLIAGIADWVGMMKLWHNLEQVKENNGWSEEMFFGEFEKRWRELSSFSFRNRSKALILHAVEYNII